MPEKVKTPVTDAVVDDFVAKIRAGVPTINVFPDRMVECEFTPLQRSKIRLARAERKASLKNGTASLAPVEQQPDPISPAVSDSKSVKSLTKLRIILYLQGDKCFFCRKPLMEEDASIEHLNPKSRGGTSTEDNEVICHKTLNQAFGDMDLKRKFEFVLKANGAFRCPGT